MPLRSPNNPVADTALLTRVRQLLVGYPTANTNLQTGTTDGTGLERVYIRDKAAMARGSFPAVNLRMGAQERTPNSRSTFLGTSTVVIEYYDAWAQSPDAQTDIRQRAADDLERIIANLEDARTLTKDGTALATGLNGIVIADDKDIFDEDTVPGTSLIMRSAEFTYGIMPYDIAF